MTGFANLNTALFSRHQPGGVFSIVNIEKHPANLWFVDANGAGAGDTVGHGKSPDSPFLTLAYAFSSDLVAAGDVVYVAPGSDVTLTAAIAADIAGVTVVGLGDQSNRPQITLNGNVDGLSVTGAGCRFVNFLFNEATAAHAATGQANIGAADVLFEDCEFNQGTNDLLGVTLTAAAERARFKRCTWRVTADGPDCGVKIEGVIDNPSFEDCVVVGSDGTNAYDDGFINNDSVATTNLMARGCAFHGAGAATTILANTTNMVGTVFGPNSYDANAVNADTDSGANLIGADNSNNAVSTANVAANKDGSVLERLEQIMEAINPDSGSALAATESVVDILYGANGIVTFPAAAAAANGVSLAEVLRYLSEKQVWRPLIGNWDFATDTGAAGAFTVFTVTGVVEVQVFAVCADSITTGGGAVTLELGVAGNTAGLIAQIVDARDLLVNEVWVDATPSTTVEPWDADAKTFIVTGGQDIIQTIGAGGLTGGTIDYHLMWRPRSTDGAVVAA